VKTTQARDGWRELVRLERLDWRLFGKNRIPGDSGFPMPRGRFERIERARAAVHARIVKLKSQLIGVS